MRVIEYVKTFAETFPLAGGGVLTAAKFLELFLFPAEKQYTYLSALSGGEKRRLQLLTILFRNPNFLILDEPTNDLDLPTLAVLENFLSDYQGCVMIVSHDRYFMDRLVDHLFVFEGDGVIRDFPGNYTQYRMSQKDQEEEGGDQTTTTSQSTATNPSEEAKTSRKKLSFKEKREFDTLKNEIEALESEKRSINEKLNNGTLPFTELQQLSERIGVIAALLDEKEMRWLELSEFA